MLYKISIFHQNKDELTFTNQINLKVTITGNWNSPSLFFSHSLYFSVFLPLPLPISFFSCCLSLSQQTLKQYLPVTCKVVVMIYYVSLFLFLYLSFTISLSLSPLLSLFLSLLLSFSFSRFLHLSLSFFTFFLPLSLFLSRSRFFFFSFPCNRISIPLFLPFSVGWKPINCHTQNLYEPSKMCHGLHEYCWNIWLCFSR